MHDTEVEQKMEEALNCTKELKFGVTPNNMFRISITETFTHPSLEGATNSELFVDLPRAELIKLHELLPEVIRILPNE